MHNLDYKNLAPFDKQLGYSDFHKYKGVNIDSLVMPCKFSRTIVQCRDVTEE